MAMYFGLVLLFVPLAAGIESLFVKREKVWELSALSGVSMGGFAWNVYGYWVAFPVVSIVLAILIAAQATRLAWLQRWIFVKSVSIAVVMSLHNGLSK